ncbi:MAG: M24 family metallopeptidase [Clostridia bacterium]|nr:M24 family metallopeptidase [Clostridia bacterium]
MRDKITRVLVAVKNAFTAYKTGFRRDKKSEVLFENFTRALDSELKTYSIKYDYLCGKDTVNIDGVSNGVFLSDGDTVLMDISVGHGGVWCDVTRTFFVGNVIEEQERAFDLIVKSIRAGEKALKVGVNAGAIYDAVNGVYKSAGKSLIHHAGHRIGRECLLNPRFIKDNDDKLNDFELFAIESGLYDGFGIRLENDYYLTADGAEDLFEDLMPLNIKEYILR